MNVDIICWFIEGLNRTERGIMQKRSPNYIVECIEECQILLEEMMQEYDFVTTILISPADFKVEVNRLVAIENYVKENFVRHDEGGDCRRWLYPRQ